MFSANYLSEIHPEHLLERDCNHTLRTHQILIPVFVFSKRITESSQGEQNDNMSEHIKSVSYHKQQVAPSQPAAYWMRTSPAASRQSPYNKEIDHHHHHLHHYHHRLETPRNDPTARSILRPLRKTSARLISAAADMSCCPLSADVCKRPIRQRAVTRSTDGRMDERARRPGVVTDRTCRPDIDLGTVIVIVTKDLPSAT